MSITGKKYCDSVKIGVYFNLKQFLMGVHRMNQEIPGDQPTERVPVMQRILDNPFLLLFIGVVVPTVFFIVWGIMELVTIPLSN